MAEKEYDFKYLPLEGKIPGKSFEYQTEKAINDLGDKTLSVESQFGDIIDIAQSAYDTAMNAQNTADTAQASANNAQTAAQNAQATADAALAGANSSGSEAGGALLAAQKAQQSANEAQIAADAAQADATEALEKTKEIDSVKNTADTALERVNNLESQIVQIEGNYEAVGTVNLNEHYSETERIYVDADSKNAPTDTEKFFVDVNVDTGMETVRQFATGAASGSIYIRNGVLTSTEPESEPLEPTDGTLVINGDLDADLTANGNVEVSGTISGTVEATGTITYGELTGDVTEGAELYECDVQVAGGTLTIPGDVSDDGTLFTESAIDIASDVTAIIYRELTISTGEDTALTNEGTLTVETAINITSSADEPIMNSGTIDGRGEIYVNDEMYYDGGILTPTNGTLVIDGDLSVDLTVNGNVEVTGEISNNVTATGIITYGSLADEAEVKENAEIYDCDFSVDEGSLTFSASLTDDDGVLTTVGTVTNSATAIINIGITVDVEGGAAFVNGGALTVNSDINTNSTDDEPVSNEGTIDGTGTLYANGEIFYDGSKGCTVEWGEWTEIALQSSVNAVKETAENALETASAAQATAENAESMAEVAQETADEALETAKNATLTGSVGSEINPIYLDDGALKASEATVGSGSTPVYLNDGELKETDTALTDYLPLSGGTLTGNLDMAEGTQFTVNGLTLTSEGHILLASGVEIY